MVKRFALLALLTLTAHSLAGCVAIPLIAVNEVLGEIDRARDTIAEASSDTSLAASIGEVSNSPPASPINRSEK